MCALQQVWQQEEASMESGGKYRLTVQVFLFGTQDLLCRSLAHDTIQALAGDCVPCRVHPVRQRLTRLTTAANASAYPAHEA